MTRFPWVSAVIVTLAVATMIALGLWQLGRADEKAAVLAQLTKAARLPPMAYPAIATGDTLWFRRATGFCLEPVSTTIEPGRNIKGQTGWRHLAACRTGAEGPGMVVDIGWSKDFKVKPVWRGGEVSGVIAPQPDHRSLIGKALGSGSVPALMLVASAPALGLQASAPPSIEDVPNNHFAYAVQWFIFAGLATLIYAIALRRRRPNLAS